MEQIVLEGGVELRDEFEKFAREYPDHSAVAVSKGFDGASTVSLIIDHAPQLSVSLSLLIAAIRNRNWNFEITRDGIKANASDYAK